MGQISITRNLDGIEGLCVITPAVHGDSRGYFMETYSQRDMAEAGIDPLEAMNIELSRQESVSRL